MKPAPPTPPPDSDDLEWLRAIRRKRIQEAGGDLKKLGDRYRRAQAERPEKVFNPRKVLVEAIRGAVK
jgi:hypothetical protein